MNKKEIARQYIMHLENGNVGQVVALFNQNGMVDSPLYGIKTADEFYRELNSDTSNSELRLKGIFEENDSNNLALYFTYKWTLKNNRKVEFDVVDIIEFDNQNKISKLKIIYDTVTARKLVEQL
ncbi:nuclear transport factor 2 family protein [Maribacter polysaccharolyticus]|uniref:nuclear transport factor 2 family protein n=1 Tax=Maribacter polysaccharolyticus TaxID=3020831 RepID=UPI00237EF0FD|nr:nuclear transport factor 2 family protein [Maribacter polysaccharolyticus]MDE3743272.1 nuclear transport factor 2 family protein [Maribacter polysaccharolyticus]